MAAPEAPRPLPYFNSEQATQPAEIADGLILNTILIVPEARPQTIAVELLVNAEGGIDALSFEQDALSERERPFVRDAMQRVRLRPARIGRLSVPSKVHLLIELQQVAGV